MKPAIHFIFLAATALALAACSSTNPTRRPLGETTRITMYKEGVPGGIIVETTKLKATVVAIDATSRTVTLAVKDGRQKTIQCGPEPINLKEIHVGDQVKATIVSELTLALANASAQPIDSSVAQAAPAPEGAKPGGLATAQQDYIAKVTTINQRRHEVTLHLPDDSTRTFTVRPDIDLSQHKVGENVSVRVSVAVALTVEKP